MRQPSLVDRALERRADEQAGPDVKGSKFSNRKHVESGTRICSLGCGRALNKNNRRDICTVCQRRG